MYGDAKFDNGHVLHSSWNNTDPFTHFYHNKKLNVSAHALASILLNNWKGVIPFGGFGKPRAINISLIAFALSLSVCHKVKYMTKYFIHLRQYGGTGDQPILCHQITIITCNNKIKSFFQVTADTRWCHKPGWIQLCHSSIYKYVPYPVMPHKFRLLYAIYLHVHVYYRFRSWYGFRNCFWPVCC